MTAETRAQHINTEQISSIISHHDVPAAAVAANVLQPLDVLGHNTTLQGSSRMRWGQPLFHTSAASIVKSFTYQVRLGGVLANLITQLVDLLLVQLIGLLVLNALQYVKKYMMSMQGHGRHACGTPNHAHSLNQVTLYM